MVDYAWTAMSEPHSEFPNKQEWSGEFDQGTPAGRACMHCIDHGAKDVYYMSSCLPLSLCGRSENRGSVHNCNGQQCPMRPNKHKCKYHEDGVRCDKELVPVVYRTGYTRYTCPDLRSHGVTQPTQTMPCFEGTCPECHRIFDDVFPQEEDILVKPAARVTVAAQASTATKQRRGRRWVPLT